MSKWCCQTTSHPDWVTLLQHLSTLNTLWALKCHTKIQAMPYTSPWSTCNCFTEWFSGVGRFHLQLHPSPPGSAVHPKVTEAQFTESLGLLQGTGSHLSCLGRGVPPQNGRTEPLPAPQGSQQPWGARARAAKHCKQLPAPAIPCHSLLPATG